MSNINPWALLILGILVGWLLSWLLELWYFRRQRLHCQRDLSRLEGQLRARNAELGAANSQISALRGEVGTRAKEIDTLLYQLASNEVHQASEPAYQQPEPEPESVAGTISESDLQDEAVADSEVVEALSEQIIPPQELLTDREHSPEQWAILRAAGILTEEDLATVSSDDLDRLFEAPEWQQTVDETLEFDIPPTVTQADTPDDLTLIAGIGPKYARLLQEHGIMTLSQLGSSDPTTLSAMFETSVGRPPDFQSWIEQAQSFQDRR